MALRLSVESNIKEFTRGLDRVQKRQIPWASKNALNDTIKGTRDRIVGRTWPRSVEERNKRFAGRAFRRKFATVKKQQATLFDSLGRQALSRQALGQVRRARRSSHLAIPINAKRTRSGKIRKRDLPSSLRANPKAFLIRPKSGHQMIVERVGRKRLPLRVLYHLTSTARVDKSFAFYEDSDDTARRAFPHLMRKRLAHALRTAR